MNPETSREAREFFSALKRRMKRIKKTELIICPPFVFLETLSKLIEPKLPLRLGAQDVSHKDSGPFTGEIGASMIKNLGGEYVIVGHSERRALGETDEQVNRKLKAALKGHLKVVLCFGEKVRDNDGKFFEFLRNQIRSAFSGVKKSSLRSIIIAYEPVWAIGKSEREYLKGEELYQMTIFIRKVLSDMHGKRAAWTPKIIYGGSVTAFNVLDVVTAGRVDGILPGRSSLNPQEMGEILKILEKS